MICTKHIDQDILSTILQACWFAELKSTIIKYMKTTNIKLYTLTGIVLSDDLPVLLSADLHQEELWLAMRGNNDHWLVVATVIDP